MTSPAEPPSYLGSAIGFGWAGAGVGAVLLAPFLRSMIETQPFGTMPIKSMAYCGAGGAVAGFALGLTYAFLRRPAANREDAE